MDPNSYEAFLRRRDGRTLTWRGPALMLFARTACAVGAQALVAAVFAIRSSPTPWHDAEPWLPVYGSACSIWSGSSGRDSFACTSRLSACPAMPLTFDARFMAFRLLSSVPHSVFVTFLYLRLLRLLPLAVSQCLDGRCERAGRRASSTPEGMNPLRPQGTEAGRPPKLMM